MFFAAAAVFLLVAGGILGVYYAAITVPGLLAGRRLEKRLREVSTAADVDEASSILHQKATSALPGVDRLIGKTGAAFWLTRLIEQAGVKTTPGTIVAASVVLSILLAFVAFVAVPKQGVLAAAFGAFAGLCVPTLWLKYKRGARLRRFEEQFPEALDLLSRAIRAGHAFQSSMGMVADEMPAPVGMEFRKSFEQQNFGLPLKEALHELSERVPLMDVRFFVTAVNIQRETGGNLAEILDNLAHVVRERFKILRQVRVHTAHGRFTGYVLLGLPAALAVALSFISPEHMTTLFTHRMGQSMIIGAIVMQTIGFLWIRKIIKIEV
jgi:tight adherence protein B